MSHYLTDSERAELERRPIPQYHFEGREQSYVDELKAMPWEKLVAHCDAIRAEWRAELAAVVDLTGPEPVIDLTRGDAA